MTRNLTFIFYLLLPTVSVSKLLPLPQEFGAESDQNLNSYVKGVAFGYSKLFRKCLLVSSRVYKNLTFFLVY